MYVENSQFLDESELVNIFGVHGTMKKETSGVLITEKGNLKRQLEKRQLEKRQLEKRQPEQYLVSTHVLSQF